MIYPDNFEQKIGFNDVRTLLKGRCMSTLGTEWVDQQVRFLTDVADVREALDCASEFARFMQESDDDIENEFYDVREPLLRVRPERTYLEELDLFNLKRSLLTVLNYQKALTRSTDEDDEDGDTAGKTDSAAEEGETPVPAVHYV